MGHSMKLAPRYVVESIGQDAVFFLRLIETLIHHPDSALLAPAVQPFASLFVVESNTRLLEYSSLPAVLTEDALRAIRPARHRAKLLLSRSSDVSRVVAEFDAIVQDERRHFVDSHRGWLAPLKRWLQPDLGLSLCDGHIFSTTHGTRFMFGDDFEGQRLREASSIVAAYCSSLSRAFGHPPSRSKVEARPIGVIMKDIKCEALYQRGPLGELDLAWSGALAIVLANANFVGKVLRKLVDVDSPSYIKLCVLCAFHAIESLRLVQDRLVSEKRLPSSAADVLRSVATPEVRQLRKRKELRDALVHFQPKRVQAARRPDSYAELLASLSGGLSQEDLAGLANSVLATVTTALVGGFDLHPGTFWHGTVQR